MHTNDFQSKFFPKVTPQDMIRAQGYREDIQALLLAYMKTYEKELTGANLNKKPKNKDERDKNEAVEKKMTSKYVGFVMLLTIADLIKNKANISFLSIGRRRDYPEKSQEMEIFKEIENVDVVSSFHCLIINYEKIPLLIDLGSVNGTTINYKKSDLNSKQVLTSENSGEKIFSEFKKTLDKKEQLEIFEAFFSGFKEKFLEKSTVIFDEALESKNQKNYIDAVKSSKEQEVTTVTLKGSSLYGLQWSLLPPEHILNLGSPENIAEVTISNKYIEKVEGQEKEIIEVVPAATLDF